MEGFLDLAVVAAVPALLMAVRRRRSDETLDGLFARLRTSKTAADALRKALDEEKGRADDGA